MVARGQSQARAPEELPVERKNKWLKLIKPNQKGEPQFNRNGQSHRTHSYGFIQTAASLVAGVGTLGLAYAIRQLTTGKTITVDIFSEDAPLSMTITEPNGMQRIPEMFPVDGGGYRIGHEFTLTESGDYLMTLTKADRTPSTIYTADFTIR